MSDVTRSPGWHALTQHRDTLADRHLLALFQADPDRVSRLTLHAAGLFLDYSKQRLTPETLDLLVALAGERSVAAAIRAMFAGEAVNRSEGRAAWHVALRAPRGAGFPQAIADTLDALASFVEQVRAGRWRGYAGKPITDVVNIGIGGSDLGPRLVCDALVSGQGTPAVHFVANVDPDELDAVLATVQPDTTLFVVVSKTFATVETLANARQARRWLVAGGAAQGDLNNHFVAVTGNAAAATAFGCGLTFDLPEWVGGRFSLWSAVGLAIALAVGMERFRQLLAGAHAMDNHFASAPLERNLPVVLALVAIWNRNFLGMTSQVVVPYSQRLRYFPAWLQQLAMESNGKSTGTDGAAVGCATSPAVWGHVGTNAQHAFFQMLHQGTDILPVDFILPLTGNPDARQQQLVANTLAQAQALMCGRDEQAVRADCVRDGYSGAQLEALVGQRSFAGNRPSNMLLLPQLDAWHLGALLAAHEHKVFVEAVIWGINPFDQWGVELGKQLADSLLAQLNEQPDADAQLDASTAGLLDAIRKMTPDSP